MFPAIRGCRSANQQISATRTAPTQRRHLRSAGLSGVRRISRSNGEVEEPRRSARSAPRVHPYSQAPAAPNHSRLTGPRTSVTPQTRSHRQVVRFLRTPYVSATGQFHNASAGVPVTMVSILESSPRIRKCIISSSQRCATGSKDPLRSRCANRRRLTVKLRAPDWSRGCTISSRARGDTTDFHGPLQRLLGDIDISTRK
jgi:hypothetical protein